MKLDASDEKKHVALWKWLAKHPDKYKWDWPHFKEMKKGGIEIPDADCFLCRLFIDTNCIKICPLKGCFGGSAVYVKWSQAATSEDRTRFALMIANCFKSPLTGEEVM